MARPRTRAGTNRHGSYTPRDFSNETTRRELALRFRAKGHTQRETSEAFDVTSRTIQRWERLHRTSGSVQPHRRGCGRKRKCTPEDITHMRQWLEENPTLRDKDIAERLDGKIATRTVNDYITELGFAPKVPARGDEPLTAYIIAETREYLRRVRRVPASRRCYIDETGIYGNEYPRRVRAREGERTHVPLPALSQRYTLYWTITKEGPLHEPVLRKENCNNETFLTYIRQHVVPNLVPGTTVIWDRLGRSGRCRNPRRIHYNPDAIAEIEGQGCSVVFLPPKGKYLNPIEEAFNALKTGIRQAYNGSQAQLQHRQRTLQELQTHAEEVAASFTARHFRAWYKHRGIRAAFDEAYPNNEV